MQRLNRNKKVIIGLISVLLIIIAIICLNFDNYDGNYQIYVNKIDDISPDRHLVVKRDGKETSKYKYIVYRKDDKEAILCYSENPTANIFSLDVDELIIVLPNNMEKKAILIKEEKWKKEYF